jgi:hypothetical protein
MKFRLIACLLLICGILIGGVPQAAGPAFIDRTNLATLTSPSSLAKSGGNLYLYSDKFLPYSPPPGASSTVYKSTNGGTTWVEADSANYPVSAVGAAVYDSANNQFIVALCPTSYDPSSYPAAMYLKTFNLTTETWGADFASPGPMQSGVGSVFKRPDGSIVVIYASGVTPPTGETTLRAAVWNGTVWSASIDLGVALLPTVPSGYVYAHGSAMDSTGVIHIVMSGNGSLHNAYQQLLTNNTLGNSFIFTGATNISSTSDGLGNMTIQNNSIFVPFMRSNGYENAVLIGTPLSAPVWSQVVPSALNIPTGTGFYLGNAPGSIGTDGTALYWEINYTINGGFHNNSYLNDYTIYKLATSCDNGATWAIVPSNLTNPYFYNFGPGGSPVDPNATPGYAAGNSFISVLHSGGTTTVYLFGAVVDDTLFEPTHNYVEAFLGYFMNSEAFSGGCSSPAVCCVACSFLGGKSSSY